MTVRRFAQDWAGQLRSPPPVVSPGSVAAKAAVLRQLELEVSRRLDGMLSGDFLTSVAGPGAEPAAARPYEPGDDARRIDWSLTARTTTAHVRTTEADRELRTWMVVDRSASLDFGTVRCEKRDVALAAMAAFGLLTVRAGNSVGVLIAGGRELRWLPSRAGRPALLGALAAVFDTSRQASGPPVEAELSAALVQLDRAQRRPGNVVVISDFLSPSGWRRPFQRLALRHQLTAVHVTDPREHELPAVGLLGVVDAETGRRMHVQTNSAVLRERYATAAAHRHAATRQAIEAAGARYLHLSTDRDWVVDVVRFVRTQRRERVSMRPVTGRSDPGQRV